MTADEIFRDLSAEQKEALLGMISSKVTVKMVLEPGAQRPTRERETDAGWDLYAVSDVRLQPGERAVVNTGVRMAIPWGYYGCIKERSGLGVKGLGIGAGVIDAGYRDVVGIVVRNHNLKEALVIQRDKAIAQIIFRLCVKTEIEEVRADMLPGGDRPLGGFGSSDRKIPSL